MQRKTEPLLESSSIHAVRLCFATPLTASTQIEFRQWHRGLVNGLSWFISFPSNIKSVSGCLTISWQQSLVANQI